MTYIICIYMMYIICNYMTYIICIYKTYIICNYMTYIIYTPINHRRKNIGPTYQPYHTTYPPPAYTREGNILYANICPLVEERIKESRVCAGYIHLKWVEQGPQFTDLH